MAPDRIELPPLALLAGGLARRLGELARNCPKALLPIAGEPFIAHQLRLLRLEGVQKVVICAGYLAEPIQDFVEDGSDFDLSVSYSLDGDVPLGTGGAIRKALPQLGSEFFVMYGDSYLPTRFAPIAESFRRAPSAGLMTVHRNQGQWDSSNVVFRDGRIVAYDKQCKTAEMVYIDYGLGLFRAGAFAGYAGNTPLDLAKVYQDLLARDELAGFEVKERFYEIGSRPGIDEFEGFLMKRKSA